MKFNAKGSYYKNDYAANQFRQKGNKKFEKNQFVDAMECYNKSLCFAAMGAEPMGLAYANRSACFLEMKMFKRCLADIELAQQNKYPGKLMKKLENRKMECLKLMESEDDQGERWSAKLDFEPNVKVPCMASVVDFRSNDVSGRHIVATEDIEIGKTVMVEQCYFGVTQYDHYKICNICLKVNQNLVPCSKCTSALFCPDCKENDLHEIECDMTFGCPVGFKLMDVVRSVSLAKNAFTNADELISFVEEMLKGDAMEFPSNLDDQRSKYRAFFKLCPNWRTYELHLQHVYLFHRLLLDQADMKAFFHTKAHGRFLMHLVQHHISMIIHGSFSKRTGSTENMTSTNVNIVAKNLDHSCTPNICHFFKDGYIKCITVRPIKKDEQLFISRTIFWFKNIITLMPSKVTEFDSAVLSVGPLEPAWFTLTVI
ncbi:SET and MYND domain-containing protein 4-like [Bradysia coprophila]|uniref:SET and MYND domain-containing protein 4-like n=1 Tax=Bradysia coprophila TaxID=38358 RepID=UPI00187D73D7|nr:SET and MYND domain-containing protein 4-like [Bradysia coprophila]